MAEATKHRANAANEKHRKQKQTTKKKSHIMESFAVWGWGENCGTAKTWAESTN
jgi:hypothetical protein